MSSKDPLESVRTETLEALVEALAEEQLDLATFDVRAGKVRDADTAEEVRAALDGLPGRGGGSRG